MRKALLCLVLIVASIPLTGQQSAPGAAAKSPSTAPAKKAESAAKLPGNAPTREDILKLFDLMQISKTMDAIVNAAKQQSIETAVQMIHEKIPNPTAEQKKQFEETVNEILGQALGPKAIQEMLEATIPVYQRHLTRTDLQAMTVFYSSPVGQKLLREQPAMVQESLQAASGIQQRIARTVFQKIDQQVEQMVQAEKQHAKQP